MLQHSAGGDYIVQDMQQNNSGSYRISANTFSQHCQDFCNAKADQVRVSPEVLGRGSRGGRGEGYGAEGFVPLTVSLAVPPAFIFITRWLREGLWQRVMRRKDFQIGHLRGHLQYLRPAQKREQH